MLMNPSNLIQIVEEKSEPFRTSLLIWASRGLREYPWRTADKSPYQILVAEILLKRTTASAAAKVYDSFLKVYPNLIDLANALNRNSFSILNM